LRAGALCLSLAAPRAAAAQDCNGNGVPDAAELNGSELLLEDHDGAALPPGVTTHMTGLWHVELGCRPAGACGASQFAYFGQPAVCDFDAGWVYGNYELRGLALPAQHEITLTFCSFYEGEGGASGADYDLAFVFVRPEGGGALELSDNVSGTARQAVWEARTADLSAYAGQTVDLVFFFNAGDDFANGTFGWGVDDVGVYAFAVGADPDCDSDGILDECEIAANPTVDQNANGILDACECLTAITCIGAPNSVGSGGRLGAVGMPSLSLNGFSLLADDIVPGEFALFFFGFSPLDPAPFGDGWLCVAPPMVRLNPAVSVDPAGQVLRPVDFTSPPTDTFAPGDVLFFQCWYRDPCVGCAGFNFTHAMSATLCP
jgi:hypothetical protein